MPQGRGIRAGRHITRADGRLEISAGHGSGGSVWIDAHILTGTGFITANGGGNGVGGEGGRIAIRYKALNMGLSQITADGGNGVYGNGQGCPIYAEQQ